MSVTVKQLLVKLDSKVTGLETGLNKANKKLKGTETASNNLKGAVGKLGKAFVGLAAVAGAGMLFKGAISSAAEFERHIANMNTLIPQGTADVAALEQGFLDLAGPLGSAGELAEAAYGAISGGVDAAEGVEFKFCN